jgi:hypothetical protein
MTRLLFAALIALAATGSFAACNSNNNPTPPAPGPTCSPPAGTQVALVYPAPGSTAIPDNLGQIIIGSTAALPSSWNAVTVSPNATVGWGTFTSVSPPFPTPNATPSFANPVYQSSAINGTFASNETVSVYINDTASANCTPFGPLGSFTTQ